MLGESQSRAQLAEAAQALGQDETALRQLERARALAEQADNPAWQATLLGVLGGAYTRAGLLDQAEQSLYEGLQLAKKNGESSIEASLLNNMGNLRSAQGRDSEAIGYLLQSQRMAQQAGNHGLAARSAMNAADLSIEKRSCRMQSSIWMLQQMRHGSWLPSHDKTYLLIRNGRILMRIGEQQPALQQATYAEGT